ncbi:MAG: PHP-associated domain-containing protein [Clostridia bacterium]
MKIDFHTHGKLSSKFPFDREEFMNKINEAKNEGIDSLALTEHCHAINFIEIYNFLADNYKYINDYYDVDGFKVFTGTEVTTNEKLDILLIGNREYIVELSKKVETTKGNQKFIDIIDLFNILDCTKLIIILAHPLRRHTLFPDIDKNIIKKIDAIEFNATDLYNNGVSNMKNKIVELGKLLNIPITGGSDSHYFTQIGSIKNCFNVECNTICEIKEQIKKKNFIVEISDNLEIRVKSSIIIKKLIKSLEINS